MKRKRYPADMPERQRERYHARKAAGLPAYKRYPRKAPRPSLDGWHAKNPEKRRAQIILQKAVAYKKIVRQPCEKCGLPNAHGHHEDYSKPLDVMWLCDSHHKERHRELASLVSSEAS